MGDMKVFLHEFISIAEEYLSIEEGIEESTKLFFTEIYEMINTEGALKGETAKNLSKFSVSGIKTLRGELGNAMRQAGDAIASGYGFVSGIRNTDKLTVKF